MITFALGFVYGIGALFTGVITFIAVLMGMPAWQGVFATLAWPIWWPWICYQDYKARREWRESERSP